ncbi:Hydrolase C26A3.11 [Schizosaccharomyces pombe]
MSVSASSLVPKDFRAFRIGLVQLANTKDKSENLQLARLKVLEAAKNGSNVIVLPEIFNSPYGTGYFNQYAEPIEESSPSYQALSSMAKDTKTYLFGGSIPERKDGKLYNTAMVFDPSGKLIAVHRKIHLFDIDIPGGVSFRESDSLSPGDAMTMVDTEYGKFGLGICYDIRFPELAMIAARNGCSVMIYPGAFNLSTGPLHWELLARARAVDNEMFVACCAPARDMNADYHSWGHSTVVDPFGKVIATTDEKPSIVYADIDPSVMSTARNSVPIYTQRRFDVYSEVLPALKKEE